MKNYTWEWVDSNKKRATKIMLETQGQDYDHVISLIMEACNIKQVGARALYRRIAREDLIDKGFVPAPSKRGRPRKTPLEPDHKPVRRMTRKVYVDPVEDDIVDQPDVVHYITPEPEPERTETGEKKSIADMKAYLESLKRKAG